MTEALRAAPNRFTVDVRRGEDGWSVAIVDPGGGEGSVRACSSEDEARIYASTVRQHIGWLSEERFREVYRLGSDGGHGASARVRGVLPGREGM